MFKRKIHRLPCYACGGTGIDRAHCDHEPVRLSKHPFPGFYCKHCGVEIID